ncbi:hypothetical protein BpHYR1_049223 [Brachionus plicatilis]|uniref:Uncharacterized protein n=1 Tax=Brachionus plicatilis TaxID=10195 RepID=A0A3M7RXM1_BRAPC|nr:hypothetical protein BpHYR1_049223 [Brachionus plicatilis]
MDIKSQRRIRNFRKRVDGIDINMIVVELASIQSDSKKTRTHLTRKIRVYTRTRARQTRFLNHKVSLFTRNNVTDVPVAFLLLNRDR